MAARQPSTPSSSPRQGPAGYRGSGVRTGEPIWPFHFFLHLPEVSQCPRERNVWGRPGEWGYLGWKFSTALRVTPWWPELGWHCLHLNYPQVHTEFNYSGWNNSRCMATAFNYTENLDLPTGHLEVYPLLLQLRTWRVEMAAVHVMCVWLGVSESG